MFNYKRGILVLLAVILVTGAGCENPTSSGSSNLEEEVFVGTQGIEMSFMEGAPPKEFYKDTAFEVMLELHNRGALDVTQGNIRIGGLPKTYTYDDSKIDIPPLLGKANYPGGATDIISWSNIELSNKYPARSDARQNINAQLCYLGEIEAQPLVCVRPRPGGKGIIPGECEVGRKTFSGGQGGPIVVTAVTETTLRKDDTTNQIIFRIEVENVGGGYIVGDNGDREAVVNKCSFGDRDRLKAEVGVIVGWLGGEDNFECKSGRDEKDKILMLNGKGVVTCTSPSIDNSVHYSLPLYIKMDYGYVNSINKAFTLKKDVF